jgi:tagaturonate epimerase
MVKPNIEGHEIYSNSVTQIDGSTLCLAKETKSNTKRLCVMGDASGFSGEPHGEHHITLCPLTSSNAAELRRRLIWLTPSPQGLRTSVGFGDRLGSATPGHIRAARQAHIQPVYAQQSVRENARTGRNPQQVLDDAMWGVFQEGWRMPWGADADHIKTIEDMDVFINAGYTFYTIDAGDYVDHAATVDKLVTLKKKAAALPWDELDSSPEKLYQQLLNHSFLLPGFTLELDETRVLRAAVKYGKALAHMYTLSKHLMNRMGTKSYDMEISIDETQTPTTIDEHFYMAWEINRLGMCWTSLAPRFVGNFEKGVDYIGDLVNFEAELARHVAVMEYFGNYKLSIHSGSDKFSIYPLLSYYTHNRVHLKTAGTSYLEALRVIASVNPSLFRSILDMARSRYQIDRASYHVSADPSRIPDTLSAEILDQFDTRQVLHVTFGSILNQYGSQIHTLLADNEELYYAVLEQHFRKHLKPFTRK